MPPPVVARFMHVCVVCGAGTREGRPANGSMRLFITRWGKNSFTLEYCAKRWSGNTSLRRETNKSWTVGAETPFCTVEFRGSALPASPSVSICSGQSVALLGCCIHPEELVRVPCNVQGGRGVKERYQRDTCCGIRKEARQARDGNSVLVVGLGHSTQVGARTWTTGGAAARHEIWRELSSLQPETAAVPCNPEQGGMLAR